MEANASHFGISINNVLSVTVGTFLGRFVRIGTEPRINGDREIEEREHALLHTRERRPMTAPAPTARIQRRDLHLRLGQPAAQPPLRGLGQLARPDDQASLQPAVRPPDHLCSHGLQLLTARRDQLGCASRLCAVASRSSPTSRGVHWLPSAFLPRALISPPAPRL